MHEFAHMHFLVEESCAAYEARNGEICEGEGTCRNCNKGWLFFVGIDIIFLVLLGGVTLRSPWGAPHPCVLTYPLMVVMVAAIPCVQKSAGLRRTSASGRCWSTGRCLEQRT